MKWLKEFWQLLTAKPMTPAQIDKAPKDAMDKQKSTFTVNQFADYLTGIAKK